jgi:hypothetical protein
MTSNDMIGGSKWANENSWWKTITSLFNPKAHLSYTKPKAMQTMESIGDEDVGVSPIAVSQPFQLFTPQAVDIMRGEVLAHKVRQNYNFSSDIAAKQVRGYASK